VSPIVVASASRAERRDGEWALSHLAASCVTRSPSRVTRGYTGTARRIEQGIKGALDVSLFMRVGAQEAVLYECRYRLLAQANAHAPHAVLPSLALAPRALLPVPARATALEVAATARAAGFVVSFGIRSRA
jgi:hypothetical protein